MVEDILKICESYDKHPFMAQQLQQELYIFQCRVDLSDVGNPTLMT